MYVMGKLTAIPMGTQRFTPLFHEKNGERRFVCNMEGWSLSSCALGSLSNCGGMGQEDIDPLWAFLKESKWNSSFLIRNFTMLLRDNTKNGYSPYAALCFARKYGTVIKEFKNKSHSSDGILQLFFFDLDEH